jgi:hypothetical protein
MATAARARARRRDRRKAKASKWRRQGKGRMGVVGHGANKGQTVTHGPDAMSLDSLEAVCRKHGLELSPVAPEPTRDTRHSARMGVLEAALYKAGLSSSSPASD